MGMLGVKMYGDDVLRIADTHFFHPIFSNPNHEFITLFIVGEKMGIVGREPQRNMFDWFRYLHAHRCLDGE